MARFKVGDKVRISRNADCEAVCAHVLGLEAVIVQRPESRYRVYRDDWQLDLCVGGEPIVARERYLEPLTDPKAEAFLESIRKLEREPLVMAKLFQGEIA